MTSTDTPPRETSRGALPAAVLFDMDGLLIDTEPLWFEVETQILADVGATWEASDHATLVGSSAAVASAFISERSGGRATPQQVADEMLSRMAKRLRETPQLQPGALRLIKELDDAGVPRALVSSSARVLIDAALDGVALSFDVIVAGDAVNHNKPHPEPYLKAAELVGADPRDCVALEDSPTGAASATAAGCVVIAVPSVTSIDPAERRVVVPSLDHVDLPFVRSLFG
ncbi:MAG TPA: HAD family phosphatase [Acidothermaceae bacterium]